jgi:Ser/Thr protein kinase RdoA (MazF antagonist)
METTFAGLSYRGQVARLRRLARAALARYDLGPGEARLTLLAHMENTTFRVDADGGARYMLRVHRTSHTPSQPRRSLANVRSEMLWLAALRRDTDLVVPAPLTSRDGALCVVAEAPGVPEPRICALLCWVDGRFINARLTPTHLERVGAFIARLHDHTATWETPSGLERGRVGHLSDEVAASILATITADYGSEDVATIERVIRLTQATQRALAHQPGSSGLIHGDLHQDNYLFHRGEVRAIDFDDCGWGTYLYDLAVTPSEIRHRAHYPALRAALLRGYQRLRPLATDHERHLDTLVAWRQLQLIVWFLEQRHHPGFAHWQASVRDGLDQLPMLLGDAEGTHPRASR